MTRDPGRGDVVEIGHEGCRASISTLGAALNDVRVPDRRGRVAPVVLGYGSRADRRRGGSFLGEIVGPFANRVAAGRFSLDGQTVELERNEGENTLHSGPNGLHRQEWELVERDGDHVLLGLTWPNGRGGFPGPLRIEASYRVDGTTLRHEVVATTARPTVVSIVCHPYFNLSGRLDPIDDHVLSVAADSYLPVSPTGIPLDEAPAPVAGPFDLRRPRLLGDVLSSDDPQIVRCGGLDHAFVLGGGGGQGGASSGPGHHPVPPGERRIGRVVPACVLTHPPSGRRLTISTDFPALQVYSGQGLAEDRLGHPLGLPGPFAGLALETEEFPDAPNRPDFPSVVVRPGDTWHRTTEWNFSVVR